MPSSSRPVVVIGAGPAGLMAAERLATAGLKVALFDAMPSVGRKFLLAGRGGLNLTHDEPFESFVKRFWARSAVLEPLLATFGPAQLRAWVQGLGISTFVGSSGRVFPTDMKAAPLLRAWLHRLREAGVVFHMRHRWGGWNDEGRLRFEGPQGEVTLDAAAVVLALGGASWSRLGSDGAWVPWLRARGVEVAPLLPANCGFTVARGETVGWSEHFSSRFAGHPVKNVTLAFAATVLAGEFLITQAGVEGNVVYGLSGLARDAIATLGRATLHVDLLPQRTPEFVLAEVARPRGSRSLSTHLKSRLGIEGTKAGLLHELLPREAMSDPTALAQAIKRLPLTLASPRPIEEAISSAGGVRFEALEEGLMLRALPGVFCAGEMLDWEAPTGGYLLTACLATGVAAADGASDWLLRSGRGS